MPIITNNSLNRPVGLTANLNSLAGYVKREGGFVLSAEALITGTGSVNLNVFKVNGSVKVFNQWAIITEITTLNNLTDGYSDIWDGSVASDLTKSPGITLSGAPVGTLFTKDKISTDTYSVNIADQGRFIEAVLKEAVPFIVTQKNGVDTFIRFNFTTTDNPVSFKMQVWFEYFPLNGGSLEFV